jgi:SAM-dependent methyltransferase
VVARACAKEESVIEQEAVGSHPAFDAVELEFHTDLDESLDPRGPDALFDLVEGLELAPKSRVVDVGCGRGRQVVELARRFGFDVVGIDPASRHQQAESQAGTFGAGSVSFHEGTAESIPRDPSSVDLIFCRESLMYAHLETAISEFWRVLRSGGRGLIYLVLTGPRMTDEGALEFWASLAPNSLRPADIEEALVRAGFVIDDRIDYGSEWGERAQEREGTAGQRLLYAARLLRQPSRYIERFGRDNYDIMLADCLWNVYRMLGKLVGYACTFTKP